MDPLSTGKSPSVTPSATARASKVPEEKPAPPKAQGTPTETAVGAAGIQGYQGKPHKGSNPAASRSAAGATAAIAGDVTGQKPGELTGKQVGTWEGVIFGDRIKATDGVGTYGSMGEAVQASYDHKGAEVIARNRDGRYDVYGVDDGRSSDFTKGNIEQVKDYPVANVSTRGADPNAHIQAFVTEDSHVFESPERHRNRFSGENYVINRQYEGQKPAVGASVDRAHHAMKGSGTDEKQLFESLAAVPADKREEFVKTYNARYGDLNKDLDGDLSNTIGGDRRLADDMLKAKGDIITERELLSQVDGANRQYEAKGGKLTDGSSNYDGALLAAHLSTPGDGFSGETSRGIPAANTTGAEYRLMKAVETESARTGKKLSPGDVYRLSLEQNGGDKFAATLTAHNMLRAQARGGESHLGNQVPNERRNGRLVSVDPGFGPSSNPQFFADHLQNIRGGEDEAGAWYHLFGTAAGTMKLGETATSGMVNLEEYAVSKDAWKDPSELRMDTMGIRMGKRLGE